MNCQCRWRRCWEESGVCWGMMPAVMLVWRCVGVDGGLAGDLGEGEDGKRGGEGEHSKAPRGSFGVPQDDGGAACGLWSILSPILVALAIAAFTFGVLYDPIGE